MKKSIAGLGMMLVLMLFKTSAQTDVLVVEGTSVGINSVSLPGGNTLKFNYSNNSFSNFSFLDSLGVTHVLTSSNATVSRPRPVCRRDQVRESYVSSQKNIGVCLCKPNPSASGDAKVEYNMTIDMPGPGPTGKALNRRVEVKLSK